ncbi:MAG: BatA domain-containing protein [Bacteroidetes bacterium]|nr:BatA domain-containing protein [Bacteroidota bacterium]
MNFLNPVFLAGLLAVSIPVLIYLWYKRKKKVTLFSSLFLFKKIEQSAIRSVKITERWLLLLRILGIILLVLGFAQPIFLKENTELPFDGVLIDESPWMMTQGNTDQSATIRKSIQSWLLPEKERFPDLSVFSTDSLSGYKFDGNKSERPVSWFHSLPETTPGGRWLVISKTGSPVLDKIASDWKTDSLRQVTVLALSDNSLKNNTGILSVIYEPLIWQVNEPNQVTVEIGSTQKTEGSADLDVFTDEVFIRTYRLELNESLTRISVPIQITTRGWHSLKLVLRSSDFQPDNEWNGGFFLPEQIPVTLTTANSQPGLSAEDLKFASAAAGIPLSVSFGLNQLQEDGIWIKSSSQSALSDLPGKTGGIVWIPDFSRPETIARELSQLGLTVKSIKPQETWLDKPANHPFWSFIDGKAKSGNSSATTFGLIELNPSNSTDFLAWTASRQPLMLLTTYRSTPVLVFLSQPFDPGRIPPPWALASLFHSILYLGSQSTGSSGFSSWEFKTGSRPVYPGNGGLVTARIADREWNMEITGTLPLTLPEAALPAPGLISFSRNNQTVALIGLNSGFKPSSGNLPESFSVIEWTDISELPFGKTGWNQTLSILFFLLALAAFLFESWLSRRRKTV